MAAVEAERAFLGVGARRDSVQESVETLLRLRGCGIELPICVDCGYF